MGQGQGQLVPRPTTPQGFPQGVGSPGRAVLGQQGSMQQGFMGMPQHGQVSQNNMGGMLSEAYTVFHSKIRTVIKLGLKSEMQAQYVHAC